MLTTPLAARGCDGVIFSLVEALVKAGIVTVPLAGGDDRGRGDFGEVILYWKEGGGGGGGYGDVVEERRERGVVLRGGGREAYAALPTIISCVRG